MPTYLIRRSPDVEEYLTWSTVVDAPTSQVMDRGEALRWAASGLPVDEDLAQQQARRRLARTDELGTSEHDTPYYGYGTATFWWREHAPEAYGEPAEIEDQPGVFIGRRLTRDELFDAMRPAG